MQYKKGLSSSFTATTSLLPPDKIRDHVLTFFRALSLTAPSARRLVHRASLLLAVVAALFSAFMMAKVEERNQLLGALVHDATKGVARADTDAMVIAISQAIYARTNAGIRAADLPLFERWEATSSFNVDTSVALKYGGYGVEGSDRIGPCGTMTRVLLNACWSLGIPARKLQLEPDAQGGYAGHTMLEFYSGGRWQVISPSDSSFTWRTREGCIATVDEIRTDPATFAQIYARYPACNYCFSRPRHIRWEKLPAPVRATVRALLGEQRYEATETPRLYDQPRSLFLVMALTVTAAGVIAAWVTRPRRRRSATRFPAIGVTGQEA